MSGMLRPNIVLLKDGTDSSQGKPQIISNINACGIIVEIIKSTLGPRGMDKLIHDGNEATITNDGATVMKLLKIAHPAAKILVDIAKSQDMEVGDGTTSVVVFCGEFLKEAKTFIEQGVGANIIIKGYKQALKLTLQKLSDIAIDLTQKSAEERNHMLLRCAETTLNSKLVADYKTFFAEKIVKAVNLLDDDMDHKAVGIKKVTGGSVTDSMLINGVAFKKTFSYAGFEQQPKRFENPKIILLNIELELKAEKDNAEVRISDPTDYQRIVDAEWKIIYDKLENIVNTGAKVVLSRLAIGDLATQYFADRGIFCAGRVEAEDLERTRLATGATTQTTVNCGLDPKILGSCGLFEEVQIGAERFNLFQECPKSKSATLIIRGGAQQFVDEADRSIHDALMIVKRAKQNTKVVGGGGAIEMELSRYLREVGLAQAGKQQPVILAFAKALEVIPRTLAQNSGGDCTDILNLLRAKHNDSSVDNRWLGVDCINMGIQDSFASYVWEPVMMKENALAAACEAACLVLSIDETITNPKSDVPKGGKGKGKGGGFSQGMANMAAGGKGAMRQMKRR